MHIHNQIMRLLVIISLMLMLSACGPKPTPDVSGLTTQIAATIYTELTSTALAIPTATPTLGITPTPLQLLPTATTTSLANLPTPTTFVIPPQSQTSTADNSKWVADVNIPDGSVLGTGDAFTKTWRFQNTGTTTWNRDYRIIYLEGNLLGKNGETTFYLTAEVAPGKLAEISVPFTAPTEKGKYNSMWKLFNPDGQQFGEYATINITVK